jgi:enoyl-CoA hydratase
MEEYGFETLSIHKNQFAATITINREAVRNSLTRETVDELRSAIRELQTDDEVSVIILTGAGSKSFASGADIAQIRDRTLLDGLSAGMQQLCREIELCEKPTIAAINGFALGGGCELAMACDIRIAADHAKLGLPELSLAIIPGAGGTQRLARLVGKGRAIEMILTGRIVTAQEAERIGLVTEVVSADELATVAEKMARQIAAKGPLAVRLAKLVIQTGFETDLQSGLVLERLAQTILFMTEDKIEGATAFLEKRKANFQGK